MSQGHRPNRRSIRLKGYDYSGPGAYFVTICTGGRRCCLGRIVDDAVLLGPAGELVRTLWSENVARFRAIQPDALMVMPNHVHAVVFLGAGQENNGDVLRAAAPQLGPALGSMIRSFKALSARQIRLKIDPAFGWQRNYYEHVVRNERSLVLIRRYIEANPVLWGLDRDNPARREINTAVALQSVCAAHGLTSDDWGFGVRHRLV